MMINGFKKLLPGLLIVAFFTATVLIEDHLTGAERAKNSWTDVQVVTYTSGVTAFFDRASGTLYLYDSYLGQPVAVHQLEELGKPMKKIK